MSPNALIMITSDRISQLRMATYPDQRMVLVELSWDGGGVLVYLITVAADAH